jgi:acetyltransferase-like isoleucine patch superfamily enzyme
MLSGMIRMLRQRLELRRYDDFTIAEYFRAQGAIIGEDCRILVRNLGPEPYLIRIGRHCTVSTEVTFVTHDGGTWVFTEEHPSLQRFGPIQVEDNCFIGTGAVLMPGVRIGPNAIVGAGAVVTRDVPPGTVYAGVPARKVADLETYKRKCLETWGVQRPAGYMSELQEGVRHSPFKIQQAKVAHASSLKRHLMQLYRRQ